jgi:hypothetical protein
VDAGVLVFRFRFAGFFLWCHGQGRGGFIGCWVLLGGPWDQALRWTGLGRVSLAFSVLVQISGVVFWRVMGLATLVGGAAAMPEMAFLRLNYEAGSVEAARLIVEPSWAVRLIFVYCSHQRWLVPDFWLLDSLGQKA